MQKELIELQPQLIQTSLETEELIAVIERESVEVQQVKAVVEIDEQAATKSANEAKAIKVFQLVQQWFYEWISSINLWWTVWQS